MTKLYAIWIFLMRSSHFKMALLGIITSPPKTTYQGRLPRPARLDHGLLPPPTFLASGGAQPAPPLPTPFWCAEPHPFLYIQVRAGGYVQTPNAEMRHGSAHSLFVVGYGTSPFPSGFTLPPPSPHPLAISFNFTRLEWYWKRW